MIAADTSVPSVMLHHTDVTDTQMIDTADFFAQGISVLFCVPGAFTPTCHNDHLPGFLTNADEIKALAVDRIVCATANDHYVTRAWATERQAFDAIEFLADFDARFAIALGVEIQLDGLGLRYQRSAFIIEQGIVKTVFVEQKPGDVFATSANAVLAALRTQ